MNFRFECVCHQTVLEHFGTLKSGVWGGSHGNRKANDMCGVQDPSWLSLILLVFCRSFHRQIIVFYNHKYSQKYK